MENKANYYKCEEHIALSYEEADERATKIFAPYGEKDKTGSRTTAEAKVRIRWRGKRKDKPETFHVILYKHVSTQKKVEVETATSEKKARHSTRHRKDRKGNRGKKSGQTGR